MDIYMPHMSGLACLEQLKKGSSEAEVILVTGKGDLQTAVEAMKLGAADFISKDASPKVVLEQLNRVLGNSMSAC